ncbi:Ig-like domain-containing protein [Moraxella bovoculi]|uniref:Ig-like domain-containing protein n=1 Tax=Moraxella bovoculi TaxID=386891 RepID=UPI000624F0ED|nr:Ig-like domain-containing protein [Moraxella bovoculi]AKG15957.2 hypothetical protein AAX08_08675 [Moraxella bovoculi]
MRNIIVKINDTTKTISQLTVVTQDGEPTIIKAGKNVNYQLIDTQTNRAPDHIITKRVGKDLHIALEDEGRESDLIIENFYADDNKAALIGQAEDGQFYYYIPDTGEVADYITELASGDVEGQALGGNQYDSPWWLGATDQVITNTATNKTTILPWLLVLGGGAAAAVALAGDKKDSETPKTKAPTDVLFTNLDEDKDGSADLTKVSGKTEPNATVVITYEGKNGIKQSVTTKADKDGNFITDNIPAPKDKSSVEISVKVDGKDASKTQTSFDGSADSPVIATSNDGSVTVTPGKDNNSLVIEFVDEAGKTQKKDFVKDPKTGKWIDNDPSDAITIDADTGVVSIPENQVKNGSQVTAVGTDGVGNSVTVTEQDQGNITPTGTAQAPTITPSTKDGSVTVAPGEGNTTLVVEFDDEDDQPQSKTFTKDPETGKWVDNDPSDDITIDADTGVVTIPQNSVKDGSPVKATGKEDGKEDTIATSQNAGTDNTIPGDVNNDGVIDDKDDSDVDVSLPNGKTAKKATDGKPNIVFGEDQDGNGTLTKAEITGNGDTPNSTPVYVTIPEGSQVGDVVELTVNGKTIPTPVTDENLGEGFVTVEVPTTDLVNGKNTVTAQIKEAGDSPAQTPVATKEITVDNTDPAPPQEAFVDQEFVETPDTTEPTVEITVETPDGGTLQAGTPAKVTFTVADDEGLDTAKPLTADKVRVVGGELSGFTKIDDTTYEATITPTAPAKEVSVTVEQGAISDNAQNQNQPKTVTTPVTDSTAPVFQDGDIEVSYAENQVKADDQAPVIGKVTATDDDSAVTGYTITSGNENGYFAIDEAGNITLTDAGIEASASSNDFENEPNEFTIEVTATNAYGIVSAPKAVKVTVTNDPSDDEPTTSEVAPDGVVNAADAVDEGNNLVTTVTLDGDKGNPSLPFALGGTNTPAEDLGEPEFSDNVTKNPNGTLNVPAGVNSFTITIPVLADDKTEAEPETVEVSVGGVTGKPVTINDASKTPDTTEPTVEITVETPDGGTLQAGTPAKVTFTVADDEGLDTAKPLTADKVRVVGGELSGFTKIDDTTYEATITPTAPAKEVSVTVEQGAISDNAQNQNQPKTVTTPVTDSTAPVFQDGDIEVSYAENQVKADDQAPVIGKVTATDDDSAVTGYTITSGNENGYFAIDEAGNITLTDAGIEASASSNDFENEPNEFTIEVTATNAYGIVSAPKAVKVTVTNDPSDDEPTTSEVAPDGVVNAADAVDEGNNLVTTVTLDGDKGNPSLPFALGGTNTPAEDLGEPEFSDNVTKNPNGTLNVPAGVNSFTITIPVLADDKTEAEPETVEVSVGGVTGKPVTINDASKTPDTTEPTVEITVETPDGGTLQAGTPAKVTFTVADDEGLDTAKPLTADKVRVVGGELSGFTKIDDTTYEATITPTAPAKEVSVTVEQGAISDNAQNQNQPKTVTTPVTDSTAPVFQDGDIEVSYAENQVKADDQAPVIGKVTATDDDSAVTGYTITSGNENGYFAIDEAGNITLTDAGIEASASSNDFENEPNEFTIEVTATNAYGIVSAPKAVKVTVTNDPSDDEPTTSEVAPDGVVNAADAVDEGNNLVTTVTLDGDKGNPSLPFALGGTNTPAEDLGEPEFSDNVTKNPNGTLNVPAGVNSFTITIPVLADDKTEAEPETVEVSVGGVTGKPVTINDASKTPDTTEPTVEITVETPDGGTLQAGTPAKVTFTVADDEGLDTAKPLTADKVRVVGGELSGFTKIDDTTYEATITPTAPAKEVSVTVEQGAISDNAQNQNQPKTVTTPVTDSTAPVFQDGDIEVSYAENQVKADDQAPVIGKVTATDDDSAVTGYTITSGNENGYFAIDEAGNITLTDAGIEASASSNDFENEPNEFTIEVTATNAYGIVSAPKAVKVTVTNDPSDDEPTTSEVAPDGVVNAADAVDEGNNLVTTVTLDGDKGNPSLPFALGGTNTPAEDLGEPEFSDNVTKNPNGTLNVPAGVNSFTITIPVLADDKTEAEPETVEVSVGGVTGKPVTINDASKTPDTTEPTVEITVETPDGGTLQAGTPAKVTFTVADDEGLDTAKPLTADKVRVVGGELSGFTKIDDTTYEATITPTAPAKEVSVTVEQGAISDNAQNQNQPKTVTTPVTDSTAPVFQDGDIEVSYAENQVKADDQAPVIGKVTATDDDSAVTGYTITSGNENGYFAIDEAGNITLTDAGIEASASSNDFENEPNEFTIEVTATNAYGIVSAPKAVKVTVTNDPSDDEPTTSEVAPDGVVNAADAVDEGNNLVTTVTLDGDKGNPSLPFALGGTNTPAEDLGEPEFSDNVTKNPNGTLNVPAGVNSFTITIPVLADDKTEAEPETVEVSVGGVTGKPVTINDASKTPDTTEPTVEITVETPDGGTLQAGTPAKVTFTVADDEGLDTAKPLTADKVRVVGGELSGFTKIDDTTYEATITPTAPAKEVSVTVEQGAISDNAQNQNQPKTVTTPVTDSTAPVFQDGDIEVSYAENQVKADDQAPVIGKVTATDDDSAVTGYTITSGNENGYFAIDEAGNITLTDAGIEASASSNDFENEPNEFTIEVTATNAYGIVSAPKAVKVTVTNDPSDDEPTTSEVAPDGVVNAADAVDEGNNLVTTVTLDGDKGNPSLPFALGGTNTPAEDLGEPEFSDNVTKNPNGTLNVPAGVNSFTITIPVLADDKTEAEPETVEVSVGGVTGKPVTINDASKTPDTTEPTVEITVETPDGGTLQAGTPAKVTFTVADDEGLDTAKPLTADKVRVVGGELSGFTKIDDTTYEATITPTAPAKEVSVTVEQGAISDNAQNQNQPKTVTTPVTDSTAPVFQDGDIEVSYAENQVKADDQAPVIGKVTATDDDSAVTGYTITSGNENGYFAIDEAGNITLTDAGIEASASSNDFENEPNEFTIEVTATNAYGIVSAPKAVKVTVTNDPSDDEPTTSEVAPDGVVNAADAVDEGNNLVTTVTLDGDKGNPSLPFALGGTNTPAEDLGEPEFSDNVTKNPNGTLNVPAGVNSFTITIPVLADDKTEAEPETVEVSVGGVTGKPVTINDASKTPDTTEPTVEITVETPDGGTLQAGTPAKVTFTVADDEGLDTAKPLTADKVRVVGGELSGFTKIDDTTYEATITPTAPAKEVSVTVEQGAISDNAQNQNQPKTVTTPVTDSTAPVFQDGDIEVSYAENQSKLRSSTSHWQSNSH